MLADRGHADANIEQNSGQSSMGEHDPIVCNHTNVRILAENSLQPELVQGFSVARISVAAAR